MTLSDADRMRISHNLNEAGAFIRKAQTAAMALTQPVTTQDEAFLLLNDAMCCLFRAERVILGIDGEPAMRGRK